SMVAHPVAFLHSDTVRSVLYPVMSELFPTLLLCLYGFFSNLRPSEPFLTHFLLGPEKNLTETQVVNEIYPVWTYSYLALLFPVFLATDYLRYKPVLILQAASFVATYAVLVWGRGVPAMQVLELAFGLASATDVAYYSYIYSVVPPASYQRVTGFCRGATLLGSAAGSLSGQLLVSLAAVRLRRLVEATLAAAVVAFTVPWFLPMPGRSLFFHRSGEEEGEATAEEEGRSRNGTAMEGGSRNGTAMEGRTRGVQERSDDADSKVPLNSQRVDPRQRSSGLTEVLRLLWRDFLRCYSQRPLLAWSAWWALSTCGYFQVVNYAQALWERVRSPTDLEIYNGYVETLATLLGAMAALAVGSVRVSWATWGEAALCLFSAVMAACVFTMDLVRHVGVCYGAYVLFRTAYMLLITVATFQIAASLSMQRYALVFGVNAFVALLLQSVLTLVVVDTAGLGLDVFSQFLIYGCYFAAIAAIFLLAALSKMASGRRSKTPAVPGETDSDTRSLPY
uniref:Solute carrier family 19 member 2 n=1 Tax=Gadus morhua TaxID=8049 RepID=A0A8C5A669_GADMO